MSYELPPLAWLRAFEAAARLNSFTGAARELNMTQPAISHQIKSLEAYLGFLLFERHARRIALTELGLAYMPAVRQAFSQLSAATGGIFGVTGDRAVTIRSSPGFATLWLCRRLPTFKQANPSIEVRLYTAIWSDVLSNGQADLEIRYGDGQWPGFEVTPLLDEPSIVACAPDTAKHLGEQPTAAEIAGHDLVRIMGCENYWDRWFRGAGIEEPPKHRGITVDNSLAALEVAAAGYGFALVLKSFAQPYLETGRVVVPCDNVVSPKPAHHLLIPETGGHQRPEVLIFRDWLLQACGVPVDA